VGDQEKHMACKQLAPAISEDFLKAYGNPTTENRPLKQQPTIVMITTAYEMK